MLCFIALLSAQAFGVVRGYRCDCSGMWEWTVQDHCHGPHHGDCHGDALHNEDESGPEKDHEQVRDDVQFQIPVAIEAPALVPVLVAVLSEELVEFQPRAVLIRSTPEGGARPPPGVFVARTIVLLI